MTKEEVCSRIKDVAIIPAIRVLSGDDAHFAAEAVLAGGIPIVEITMTVPGAVELISHLVRNGSGIIVGAGTVTKPETASKCIEAGASFITSPSLHPAVIDFVAKKNVAMVPGAMTPTEISNAWDAGSDFVKVFPCGQIGGDRYIRAIHAAFPQIQLIAAGGINQHTAAEYILSGATAIGVGTELIPTEAIERRQKERIRELATRFAKVVKGARSQIEEWEKEHVVRKFNATEKCEK